MNISNTWLLNDFPQLIIIFVQFTLLKHANCCNVICATMQNFLYPWSRQKHIDKWNQTLAITGKHESMLVRQMSNEQNYIYFLHLRGKIYYVAIFKEKICNMCDYFKTSFDVHMIIEFVNSKPQKFANRDDNPKIIEKN